MQHTPETPPDSVQRDSLQRDSAHTRTQAEIDALATQVQKARKYASLDISLVRGVVAAEWHKGRRGKAAVKAAKTKLHQVVSAYQARALDYAAWLNEYDRVRDEAEAARRLCLEAMQSHASTSERLPFLEEFFATLFVDLPAAPMVVDLACGLNPLALDWIPLPTGYRYWACDIDRAQIEFLNAFFARDNLPATAHLHDLLHGDPAYVPPADVVLLFKTLPCLEQVDSNAGARLLAGLDCQIAFVSFPTRSLGGRQRGMVDHYAHHFAQIAPADYTVRRHEFPNELVFRLDRKP